MSAFRRLRAFAGQFALLAALALVAALLVTAAPRIANDRADRGLRQDLAALPSTAGDLRLERTADPAGDDLPAVAAGRLDDYGSRLPAPLPGLLGQRWFAARVGPDGMPASAGFSPFNGTAKPAIGLRAQTGAFEAARLTAGRWPANAAAADRPVEVAVSARVAAIVGLPLDATVTLGGTMPVVVVGVFEPVDAAAPTWADMGLAVDPYQPVLDGETFRAVALTDPAGITAAGRLVGPLVFSWRYAIDRNRIDASMVDAATTAVTEAGRVPPAPGLTLTTDLDVALSAFAAQVRAVRALLGVVQAGILATLLGLLALAARLAVERRRAEFALLRARGAAAGAIGVRTLVESALVLPAAALAGWAVGTAAPGRRGATDWLVVVVAVLATLALPVLAVVGQRQVSFVARRQDVATHRPSVRRLTLEVLVLVLGAVGAYLLRRRGLSQDATVDPYLVSVPVLLALGAALIAVRVFPWPLRLVGRLATHARGAVLFLGLTRAGRGSPVTTGPLAVLVLAITTGVFSGVVATTIAAARDRATDQEIAADARLDGFQFAPATGGQLARVPGVRAVAAMSTLSGAGLLSGTQVGARRLGQAQVVVVDGAELARVLAASGVPAELPAAFVAARPGGGPVPAVVSPDVAAGLPAAGGVADVQGRFYAFTAGAVAARFPGLDVGARRFVVLPAQALPVTGGKPVVPNRFLLAGAGLDPAALRAAGDAGQRAQVSAVLGREASGIPSPSTVTTWEEHRLRLDRTGANEVLSFAFVTGTVGAGVLALLAVGFTVLAEVRSRGRVLSRLRTMGLSGRQGQGLLAYELAPLVGAAVLAGGAVGASLPAVLAPALGLSSFTAGVPADVRLDPLVPAGMLVLVVVALAGAVLTENVVNRRWRLGEVLRVGEESA